MARPNIRCSAADATPKGGGLTFRTGTLLWDGRGEDGRLRIGIYVVVLEAVNVEGGTSEAHRAAVVLARPF